MFYQVYILLMASVEGKIGNPLTSGMTSQIFSNRWDFFRCLEKSVIFVSNKFDGYHFSFLFYVFQIQIFSG